jgi:ATP-dependent DNA ligase
MPEWVEPMAATLTQERFTGPEWIFERKLDGIRVLAFKQERDVRLLSRNRTVHGKLRHARLLGIRSDKSPRDVVRESH